MPLNDKDGRAALTRSGTAGRGLAAAGETNGAETLPESTLASNPGSFPLLFGLAWLRLTRVITCE
jgi:hypothetical protein